MFNFQIVRFYHSTAIVTGYVKRLQKWSTAKRKELGTWKLRKGKNWYWETFAIGNGGTLTTSWHQRRNSNANKGVINGGG